MSSENSEQVAKPVEVQEGEGAMMVTAQAVMTQSEVQGALVVAKQFPRDEDRAYASIIKSCNRPRFAEGVSYSFPRGGSQISGPSIKLAREMARCMGNIRHGFRVIRDTEEERTIEAFAWDTENNTWITASDTFQKLIQRKGRGWVKPDERDLRELTFRRAAIIVRNCILQLMPSDFIEDAVDEANRTIRKSVEKDPDQARKNLIKGFARVAVKPEQVTEYLGKSIDEATADDLTELRGILSSLLDGNTTWAEHVQKRTTKSEASGKLTEDDLAGAATREATDEDGGKPATGEGSVVTLSDASIKKIREGCAKEPVIEISAVEEEYADDLDKIKGKPGQTQADLLQDVLSTVSALKKAAVKAASQPAEKDGGDEPEADGGEEEDEDQDPQTIDTEGQQEILTAAREAGVDMKAMTAFLKSEYGTSALGKLPAVAKSKVLDWISENKS